LGRRKKRSNGEIMLTDVLDKPSSKVSQSNDRFHKNLSLLSWFVLKYSFKAVRQEREKGSERERDKTDKKRLGATRITKKKKKWLRMSLVRRSMISVACLSLCRLQKVEILTDRRQIRVCDVYGNFKSASSFACTIFDFKMSFTLSLSLFTFTFCRSIRLHFSISM
jgi:hypothetical protein